MKTKLILLSIVLLLSQTIFSQSDPGSHETGETDDGDKPGPFTKYGWIIIVGGLAWGFYKTEQKNKNSR